MIENSFSADGLFVVAVLAMTAVTYFMRAGGYWVMGRVPLTPRVRRALEALPGAIIVSTILPIALKGGVAVVACLVVSGTVMAWVRKDFIAVVCAVAAAAAIRAFGY
ncbi:AzlD family protein [Roseibium algae]|uniref:AzlD domain-containing protein n=1 Tax=Roseibium algae TaxID=3123038 RepID=A0ABU8THI0_9HYPH